MRWYVIHQHLFMGGNGLKINKSSTSVSFSYAILLSLNFLLQLFKSFILETVFKQLFKYIILSYYASFTPFWYWLITSLWACTIYVQNLRSCHSCEAQYSMLTMHMLEMCWDVLCQTFANSSGDVLGGSALGIPVDVAHVSCFYNNSQHPLLHLLLMIIPPLPTMLRVMTVEEAHQKSKVC